jgi:hypothetical protein
MSSTTPEEQSSGSSIPSPMLVSVCSVPWHQGLEQTNRALSLEVQKNQLQIHQLQQDLKHLRDREQTLETANKTLDNANKQYIKSLEEHKESIREHAQFAADLKEKNLELQARLKSQQDEIDNLRKQIAEQDKKLTEQDKKVAEQDKKLAELEKYHNISKALVLGADLITLFVEDKNPTTTDPWKKIIKQYRTIMKAKRKQQMTPPEAQTALHQLISDFKLGLSISQLHGVVQIKDSRNGDCHISDETKLIAACGTFSFEAYLEQDQSEVIRHILKNYEE